MGLGRIYIGNQVFVDGRAIQQALGSEADNCKIYQDLVNIILVDKSVAIAALKAKGLSVNDSETLIDLINKLAATRVGENWFPKFVGTFDLTDQSYITKMPLGFLSHDKTTLLTGGTTIISPIDTMNVMDIQVFLNILKTALTNTCEHYALYTMDLVTPQLTADNDQGCQVIASGEVIGNEAYKALTGYAINESDAWVCNIASTIIAKFEVILPQPTLIEEYMILPRHSADDNNRGEVLPQAPRNWIFEGSNDDGNTYTLIESVTNYNYYWDDNWNTRGWKYYEKLFPTPITFQRLRLTITANNGDNTYTSIGDLQFRAKKQLIQN